MCSGFAWGASVPVLLRAFLSFPARPREGSSWSRLHALQPWVMAASAQPRGIPQNVTPWTPRGDGFIPQRGRAGDPLGSTARGPLGSGDGLHWGRCALGPVTGVCRRLEFGASRPGVGKCRCRKGADGGVDVRSCIMQKVRVVPGNPRLCNKLCVCLTAPNFGCPGS